MWQRLVDVPGLLAPDSELDHDEVGPVERRGPVLGLEVVREHGRAGGLGLRPHPGQFLERLLTHAFDHGDEGVLREPLDELGRIRAAGTDDRDLEADLRGPPSTAGAGARSRALTPRVIVYNITTCSPQPPIPGPNR